MNKLVLLCVSLILIIFGAYYFQNADFSRKVTSFDECVSAGYPVMESYPQQCRVKDGKTFTQDIGNELEMMDLITVDFPRPNSVISNPLKVKGAARGTWFFEANAGARLVDMKGKEIASGTLTALGNWMTEEFVDFFGEVSFQPGDEVRGTLILEKANPSGLPENEQKLLIPVKFK